MAGFMSPLMGGAAAAKGSPGSDLPGNFLVQSLLHRDRLRRNSMKIGSDKHSFDEAHQSGGDYEVGEGPAVSSGALPDTAGSVGGRRTRTAPGDASETDPYSYLREEIDRTRRDQMKIDQDPTVQGVKTDKGKRRGGSGRSRGGKKGEGKRNYYEDKKSGTGVHT